MGKFQPKLILCPTDFSELATFALQYANLLARLSKATLVVLYADPFLPPPHFTATQMDDVVRNLEISKRAAREHLDRYVISHVASQVKTESLVIEDRPVSAIVNTAVQRGVDLVVMGTHGRGGLSRVMLGSVTERVLRESVCPVLTVRHKEAAAEFRTPSIQRVLCPVNFSEISANALSHAASIAELFGAELSILHVLESPLEPAREQEEKDRLCRWVSSEVLSGCVIQEQIRQGHAAEQIIDLARSTHTDLIVLGAQHKRFFDATVLGTTTVRVTRHAGCPVLTVMRKNDR